MLVVAVSAGMGGTSGGLEFMDFMCPQCGNEAKRAGRAQSCDENRLPAKRTS